MQHNSSNQPEGSLQEIDLNGPELTQLAQVWARLPEPMRQDTTAEAFAKERGYTVRPKDLKDFKKLMKRATELIKLSFRMRGEFPGS